MTLLLRRWSAAGCGAILGAALVALACGADPGATDVSQSELLASVASANVPLLLDVRTPEEFAAGHVPSAVNIPHDILEQRLGEIDGYRDKEVVVYCERGGRAAKAAVVLSDGGFSSVRHLAGDMAGWRQAGLPITK